MKTTPNSAYPLRRSIPFALGCLTATPAMALVPTQTQLLQACIVAPSCIADAYGTPVGVTSPSAAAFGILIRPINGTPYQISFFRSGFDGFNTSLFFSGASCTGNAFVLPVFAGSPGQNPQITLPFTAQWDGTSLWGPAANVALQPNVQIQSRFLSNGGCTPDSAVLPNAIPVSRIETPDLYPPFTAKWGILGF